MFPNSYVALTSVKRDKALVSATLMYRFEKSLRRGVWIVRPGGASSTRTFVATERLDLSRHKFFRKRQK